MTDEAAEVRLPNIPPQIAAAIMQVKSGIAQLGFDDRNEHGRYNYASVDKFYTSIRPLEAEAGLLVMLDEIGCDIKETTRSDDRGQTKTTSWVFLKYEVWLGSVGGEVWGPVRRHWAGPVTGPQTFGAAESYVRKAFARGLYEVPTGERDGDDVAPRDDAPAITLSRPPRQPGATRVASPQKLTAAPSTAAPANGQETAWIDKFLTRKSYEIDPQKVQGGWSAWETAYLDICRHATQYDQIRKLEADNANHFSGLRDSVRKVVFDNFWTQVKAEEKRLWPPPDTSIVDEMSGATA